MEAKRDDKDAADSKNGSNNVIVPSRSDNDSGGASTLHRAESKSDTDESTGARTLGDNDDEVVEEECKGSDMNIIGFAIEYCESRDFQSVLEAFKQSHVSVFGMLAESKNPEDEEQTLEHMSVFNGYR